MTTKKQIKKKVSSNEAWNKIFEDLKILDHIEKNSYFDISADEIKKRDGKEARLMTKFDHRERLPKIMADNKLSILAIKNGFYRIAKTNPFINIKPEPQCKIIEIDIPEHIMSIDALNIKSESEALDIAYISKMLTHVFNEETLLTVRGRLRGSLNFCLNHIPYEIDKVQIEVDGGYEGQHSLHLIEAKIGYRSNINIRQLLYPELFWEKQKVGTKKEIKSYIFYYQDNIFRFIPFDKNSLQAIHDKELAFKFKEKSNLRFQDIQFSNIKQVDSNVPFPQADDFGRVYSMFLSFSENKEILKNEAMQNFDLVNRQFHYYLSVLIWMKLCIQKKGYIIISPQGEKLLSLNFKEKLEEFSKIIFSDPICLQILKGTTPNPQDWLKMYRIKSKKTIKRRMQTIQSWIKYFNYHLS